MMKTSELTETYEFKINSEGKIIWKDNVKNEEIFSIVKSFCLLHTINPDLARLQINEKKFGRIYVELMEINNNHFILKLNKEKLNNNDFVWSPNFSMALN